MKLLVRALPASIYTSNMVPNIWSGWSKPTRSGSMVLYSHGQWLCSQIPLYWGSRTSKAGLWSGAGLTRNLPNYTQKYTVVYLEPIRSLLDPFQVSHTIIGTSDSLGLTRTHSELGYLPNYTQKYTVVYLEPIRSLLDPFQVSHTIIGTSDSLGLTRTHSELPGLGLSPEILSKVHGHVPWANPFTIRPFSGVPHYYWDVGLPQTPSDSLGITRTWAISRNTPISTRSCTLGQSVHY